MDFDWRSAGGESLLDAFGSGRGVEEPDSLKNRAFSIILHRASIFSLCLVCADAMVVATAELTTLEIKCYITGFIAGGDIPEVSSWNSDITSK